MALRSHYEKSSTPYNFLNATCYSEPDTNKGYHYIFRLLPYQVRGNQNVENTHHIYSQSCRSGSSAVDTTAEEDIAGKGIHSSAHL
jgi:hypothetical protein